MSTPKLVFNAQGSLNTWLAFHKCGILIGNDGVPVFIGPNTQIDPAASLTAGGKLALDFTEVDGYRYATSVKPVPVPVDKKKNDCDCDCDCKKKPTPPAGTRHRGKVRWFNPVKGYGFLDDDTTDKPVFVHISAVERAGYSTLNEGQRIEFDVISNRGKVSAENLRII